MKFKDQVQFVRQNIKKNRLRIFMTILATTIGCAFLIVLASVGFGLHKSITSEILEQDIVTKINVFGKDNGDEVQMPTGKDLEEIKSLEHVNAVVVNKYSNQSFDLSLKDRMTSVAPIFTNIEEWKKTGVKLSEGRLPKRDGEVVVGYHFANYLNTEKERKEFENNPPEDGSLPEGYKGDLIGQTVSMKVGSEQSEEVIPLKIVGILDEPANEWAIDTNVIVSDQAFNQVKSIIEKEPTNEEMGEVYSEEVNVYASNLEHVKPTLDELKNKGYHVYSVTEQLDSMNVFFLVFKIGLIFIGTVAVLIASIGIFNTMTMAVTERTQEIGIMKAIGAQPNVIRRIFLMESAWIGVVGAILGVIISYGISGLCNWIIPMVLNSVAESEGPEGFLFSYIPLSLVLIAFGISVGVAIISGLRPAFKATNIPVLSALRKEI